MFTSTNPLLLDSCIKYADDICAQLRRQDALAAITITAIQSERDRLNKEKATQENREMKDKESDAQPKGVSKRIAIWLA